ncbi:hypothetical protein [Kribbella sp. NPDC050459]|uniref:hypothetical protein n=1 Tax=Kribbella sp. NPDC050459 TaxID=3155785 RepID=UPI0033D07A4C
MTHSVEISGATLTKHYTSWSRDEPTREWTALTLLSRTAPGLTPIPLALSIGGTPWITMTLVPGHPLQSPLTQTTAVGDALETLWSAPYDGLQQIDLQALVDRTRTGLTALADTTGVIGQAARTWLDNEPPDLPGTAEAQARRILRLAAG